MAALACAAVATLLGVAVVAGCGATTARRAHGRTGPAVTAAPAITAADTPTTARLGLPASTLRETTTTTVPSRAVTTTTTSPLAAEQAALDRLEAGLPGGDYAISAIQQAAPQPFVVVGRDISTRQAVIDVDVYVNEAWRPQVINIGLTGNLDPVVPGTIQSGQVTASPVRDFLVLLKGGGGQLGVLLSDAGGVWHTVGLEDRGGAGASDELVEPRFVGSYVTQAVDDCAPTCGQGPYSVTTYGFDPATGELAQVGPVVQSDTP